jgi:hypothetical protein
MNTILIFAWIWAAFIATSFWESSIEGRNAWAKKQVGWEIKITKNLSMTRYHFYLFWVMIPLLLTLPLVIYGWNLKLFGILASAYFSGIIIEDFFWYVVNPKVKLKELYTPFSDYYPWIKIGKKKIIPLFYIIGIALAITIFLLTT